MSEEKKGALIITQLPTEGSCSIGSTLISRGFRTKTISAPRVDLRDIDPLRPEVLVVMGGPIGVYQHADYPFLKQEVEILKARLEADKPTIGVCLGAQLMATALGSKVYPGDQGQELGWAPLQISEAGHKTPVRHFDSGKTNMFHWHGDTFDLPTGATLLASSEKYENQIYQSGENGLGLQCHPEVRHGQLQEWFVKFVSQITGDNPVVSIHTLREDTKTHIDTLNTQAETFFNEWLEERGL